MMSSSDDTHELDLEQSQQSQWKLEWNYILQQLE